MSLTDAERKKGAHDIKLLYKAAKEIVNNILGSSWEKKHIEQISKIDRTPRNDLSYNSYFKDYVNWIMTLDLSLDETNVKEKLQKSFEWHIEHEPKTTTTPTYPPTPNYKTRSWGFFDTTTNYYCEQIDQNHYICNINGQLKILDVQVQKIGDFVQSKLSGWSQ